MGLRDLTDFIIQSFEIVCDDESSHNYQRFEHNETYAFWLFKGCQKVSFMTWKREKTSVLQMKYWTIELGWQMTSTLTRGHKTLAICCYGVNTEEVWLSTNCTTVSTFVILSKHKSAICSKKLWESLCFPCRSQSEEATSRLWFSIEHDLDGR